jgi:hypothetical protein
MIINRVGLKLFGNPTVQADSLDALRIARTSSKSEAVKHMKNLSSFDGRKGSAVATSGTKREECEY